MYIRHYASATPEHLWYSEQEVLHANLGPVLSMPILVISRSKVLQLLGVEEQIKQATNDFTVPPEMCFYVLDRRSLFSNPNSEALVCRKWLAYISSPSLP
jgi:hypothetical protein